MKTPKPNTKTELGFVFTPTIYIGWAIVKTPKPNTKTELGFVFLLALLFLSMSKNKKLPLFLVLWITLTLTLLSCYQSIQISKVVLVVKDAQFNVDIASQLLVRNATKAVRSTTTTTTITTTTTTDTKSFWFFPSSSSSSSQDHVNERQNNGGGNGYDNNQLALEALLQASPKFPVVDILSVGSIQQPYLQTAQQETMGSHRAVRHFYRATEHDDSEAECHTKLTTDLVRRVANYCRTSDETRRQHQVLSKISHHFFTEHQLMQKSNPVGWLCAQKRPLEAFAHMIQQYKYREEPSINVPDYLLIMDDDTWVNLDAMLPLVSDLYPVQHAHVVAGCLMITRANVYNFTVPYGGYGLIFTRKAIQNWLRPIHCDVDQLTTTGLDPWSEVDNFEKLACWRLQQNGIGERDLFRNGMSIVDLMQAYTRRTKFGETEQWEQSASVGFCMHSDWAWAYFANYYHIAQLPNQTNGERHHFHDPTFFYDRITGYNHSWVHPFDNPEIHPRARSDPKTMQQCANGIDLRDHPGGINGNGHCGMEAHICHRITQSHMRLLHNWNRVQAPEHYHDDDDDDSEADNFVP